MKIPNIQETKLRALGLTAMAVNSVSKAEADKNKTNIWRLVESGINVILLSPEMLSSSGFSHLIDSKIFQARLFVIAVDEVHLLGTWGNNFRTAFRQIGFVRARFSTRIPMFAMTATLQKRNLSHICSQLGFTPGKYHLVRLSNARPNIQLIFRTLNSSLTSGNFPELSWVLQKAGKTLIFCPTIRVGFNLAVYLWHIDPQSAVKKNIRLFNSLHSPGYNAQTMKLLEGDETSRVTIATDKLSVGVDISDFKTVVIIDPKDLDDLWQKGGRAGRNTSKIQRAQVITYIPSNAMKIFYSSATASNPSATEVTARSTKRQRGSQADEVIYDSALRDVALATCHPAELNL